MIRRIVAALVLAALWPSIKLFEVWGRLAEHQTVRYRPADVQAFIDSQKAAS